MPEKNLLTWGELANVVAAMVEEEKASPVLVLYDSGYFGVRKEDLLAVPEGEGVVNFASGGLNRSDVKAGRKFLQL